MTFVVECKPDETLLSLVANSFNRGVIHQANKPEVLKYVKKKNSTLGMIDEDPDSIQPPIMRQLTEIESLEHLGLRRTKFSNGNTVIILLPRLEDWTLKACETIGVDVRRYNLPQDGELFHDIVNVRIDNFRRLTTDIMNESERHQKLAEWLGRL